MQVGRQREESRCSVGQSTRFPHFLEDDRVHPAAEILIIESDIRIGSEVKLLTTVGILQVIELVGIIVDHEDLALIAGQAVIQILPLDGHEGVRHIVVGSKGGQQLLTVPRPVVEHLMLLAEHAAHLGQELF